MNNEEVLYALVPLIRVFEMCNIPYYIGGSVASSVYGEKRATQDADIVADIQPNHVSSLVRLLKDQYYIDGDMIRDAIRRKASFNIIYLDLMFKIDVFIPKARPFAQQERLRARPQMIEEVGRSFYLSSPEDIVLNKLEWYKMGEESSTRQWKDILAVLNRQRGKLDLPYLRHWAENLAVLHLLERAYREVGMQE